MEGKFATNALIVAGLMGRNISLFAFAAVVFAVTSALIKDERFALYLMLLACTFLGAAVNAFLLGITCWVFGGGKGE